MHGATMRILVYIVHCWLIVKVILQNARCNNEDIGTDIYQCSLKA